MIDSDHPSLSITRQRQLVSISRSGFYYQPSGESELNLTLMRLIDEQHMRRPQMARQRRKPGVRRTGSGGGCLSATLRRKKAGAPVRGKRLPSISPWQRATTRTDESGDYSNSPGMRELLEVRH